VVTQSHAITQPLSFAAIVASQDSVAASKPYADADHLRDLRSDAAGNVARIQPLGADADAHVELTMIP
jgi:hypothetical protein